MVNIILQFPDLIGTFFNDLPAQLGDFFSFLRAVCSLLGLIGVVISVVCLLLSAKVKFKGLLEFMIFSFVLLFLCGFDYGLRYFKIV